MSKKKTIFFNWEGRYYWLPESIEEAITDIKRYFGDSFVWACVDEGVVISEKEDISKDDAWLWYAKGSFKTMDDEHIAEVVETFEEGRDFSIRRNYPFISTPYQLWEAMNGTLED